MQNINRINVFRYFKFIAIPVLAVLVAGYFYLQTKTNQTTEAIEAHFADCSSASIVGVPANPLIVNACGTTYAVSLHDRWNPFRRVSVKEAVKQ